MLTSKERAELRSSANKLTAIFSLGKDGITPEFTKAIDSAIEVRELIKINILQNCELLPREAADSLSTATGSEVVQVIGSKFVLYRKSQKKDTPVPAPISKATAKRNDKKNKGRNKR
jgi:RNA-binding protein